MQQMKGDDKTFAQLAESALAKVLHEGAKNKQIDVVFDVYKEKRKEPTEVQTEAFSSRTRTRSHHPTMEETALQFIQQSISNQIIGR